MGSTTSPATPPGFRGTAPKPVVSTGAVGHDISWPQCDLPVPAPGAFGVVGVTGGRPYTQNRCLSSQFAWAEATPGGASFYMNTSNPGPDSETIDWYSQRSPDPDCSPENELACAYDFGFNAAAHAFAYAQSATGDRATGRVWWLDVELDNSWKYGDIPTNRASLQGSLEFLERQPGVVVGVYSTPRMWGFIAGDHYLPVPNWMAGATNEAEAIAHCAPGFSATGGPVVLSQWVDEFDHDYVC